MAYAQGEVVLDFGGTPIETGSVVVSGQADIAATDHVEAFFMKDSTADNNAAAHEEAAAVCPLVCGSIVAGTSFTIFARSPFALLTGDFNIRWTRNGT